MNGWQPPDFGQQPTASRAALREAIAQAEGAQRVARALDWLWSVRGMADADIAAVITECQGIVARLPQAEGEGRWLAYLRLRWLLSRVRIADVVQGARQLTAECEAAADRTVMVYALIDLAMALNSPLSGRVESLRCAEQAVMVARGVKHRRTRAYALIFLGMLYAEIGQIDRAEGLWRRAWTEHPEVDREGGLVANVAQLRAKHCLHKLTRLDMGSDDRTCSQAAADALAELALHHAGVMVEAATRERRLSLQTWGLVCCIEALLRLGRTDDARLRVKELEVLCRRGHGRPIDRVASWVGRGALAQAFGHHARAARLLGHAVRGLDQAGLGADATWLMPAHARSLERAGRPVEAAAALNRYWLAQIDMRSRDASESERISWLHERGQYERDTAYLVHDIRNSLATVAREAERRDGTPHAVVAAVQRAADATLELCASLGGVPQDERPGDAPPERFEAVDLAEVLAEARARLGTTAAAQVRIVLAPGPQERRALADRALLVRLFVNLLNNACRAAEDEVVATVSGSPGRCEVTVADRGPGFPAPVLARHRGGSRLGADTMTPPLRRPSSVHGFGLRFAAEVVRLHGGTLGLHNAPAGALVRVLLPAAR